MQSRYRLLLRVVALMRKRRLQLLIQQIEGVRYINRLAISEPLKLNLKGVEQLATQSDQALAEEALLARLRANQPPNQHPPRLAPETLLPVPVDALLCSCKHEVVIERALA